MHLVVSNLCRNFSEVFLVSPRFPLSDYNVLMLRTYATYSGVLQRTYATFSGVFLVLMLHAGWSKVPHYSGRKYLINLVESTSLLWSKYLITLLKSTITLAANECHVLAIWLSDGSVRGQDLRSGLDPFC